MERIIGQITSIFIKLLHFSVLSCERVYHKVSNNGYSLPVTHISNSRTFQCFSSLLATDLVGRHRIKSEPPMCSSSIFSKGMYPTASIPILKNTEVVPENLRKNLISLNIFYCNIWRCKF